MELWTSVAMPAFATLFVVIDPIGLIPMFIALTSGADAAAQRKVAVKAVFTGTIVLALFAFAGEAALNALGISLPAFRIAGGLLLFIIAVEMLFEKRTERRQRNVAEANAEAHHDKADAFVDDISVFPLGLPLIAGPGAIASIILLMSQFKGDIAAQATVFGVLVGVLLLTLILFVTASRFAKYVSPEITKAFTRVLGMILAALAVQFVLTGLNNAGLVG
ncbi:MAG: MarC family protein [Hyphomicrobiales bacterium]